MTDDLVAAVPDAGLGNTSYLVDLGDGRGLAVDACRDLRALRREADRRGLQIAYAAETHLHADFVSGAVQLAATDGAQVLASQAGDRAFPHVPLRDGDEVELGGLTLHAIGTPGHTDEHLSFLLRDGDREIGVFSGGSLIAGSAARVDLVAPERTMELAAAQYHSVHRIAELGDATLLWPTHGGGSFCSSSASRGGGANTIGAERATNPLLVAAEEGTFVRMLLDTLGSYPTYFDRLGELNRRGPSVLDDAPRLRPLSPPTVAALLADGVELVDVRPIAAFAAEHPAGAVSIPLRPELASWLGWLVAADRPVVVIREPDQDADDLLWQALKIGYEDVRGEVAGGIVAWRDAGLPTRSVPLIGAADVADLRVLDVRQDSEFAEGHVPGAAHLELGELTTTADGVDDVPTAVMCGHGERAMSAASLLLRAGKSDVRVVEGGPDDVASARGTGLVSGG